MDLESPDWGALSDDAAESSKELKNDDAESSVLPAPAPKRRRIEYDPSNTSWIRRIESVAGELLQSLRQVTVPWLLETACSGLGSPCQALKAQRL